MKRLPLIAIVSTVVVAACLASSPSQEHLSTPSAVVPSSPSSNAPSAPPEPTPIVTEEATEPPGPSVGAIEDVPSAEGVLNAVWVGVNKVVTVGFVGPVFTSTILLFEDGAWSTAEVPDVPGQVTGIAELGGKLFAVGNSLPDVRSGFIWESSDGRSWRNVQTIENAALYDMVAGHGAIVAVGARLDDEMNSTAAAWSSTDGRTWTRAKVEAAAGRSMGTVTETPEGFAAAGDRRLGEARPFWTTETASDWVSLRNDLDDQLLPIDLDHHVDDLALVGASGKSGDQHPFIARSVDGRDWTQTNLSTEEGYASAVTAAGERLVVAGVDADRLTVWSLHDADWRATTLEAGGASISAMAWDPNLGLLAVGTRDGLHAVWLIDLG